MKKSCEISRIRIILVYFTMWEWSVTAIKELWTFSNLSVKLRGGSLEYISSKTAYECCRIKKS